TRFSRDWSSDVCSSDLRSGIPSLPDKHGISRFPLKMLAYMLRVSDRAGSKSVSRYRRLQSCLPLSSTTSAPRSGHRWRDGGSIRSEERRVGKRVGIGVG